MNKFLETYSPPRISHKEIDILNKPIASSETEPVIKNKQKNIDRSLGLVVFTGDFYQT